MVFAFLFVGVFFVGCNVDYSKIEIVPSQTEINLKVGESKKVVFTIENYQSGFSNKVKVNPRSDGSTAVFETSNPVYVSKNQIEITVTGVAGGQGEMWVTTLEAGKECSVTVNVTQYTTSMDYNNRVLYVSNKTAFVPDEHMFVFDLNTTYKELSYYYLSNASDVDFKVNTLTKIDYQNTKTAEFSDGVSVSSTVLDIQKFNRVELNNENALILYNNEESVRIDDPSSEFLFLAVYDYSLDNEDDYSSIVYDVATVYVLPDLDITITGWYEYDREENEKEEIIDHTGNTVDNIVIVPNNSKKMQYILKIQMNNALEQSPIKINKYQENDYLNIDFFEYEDEKVEGIYYLKISQNSQTQKSTRFTFEVCYDIAQGIEDESVNKTKTFNVEIKIAPNSILVNGTPEPDTIVMYNYYKFPEFGWNELMVDVISGYSSLPNFDGIYFDFADVENYVDIVYDGVTVKSGNSKLYTDLSKSFYIRGKLGSEEKKGVVVKICCVATDIMEEEIFIEINCDIIKGATKVMEAENHDSYYLDISEGEQDFSRQIWAAQKFQFATYKFLNGLNVVDIEIDNENPYIYEQKGETGYYYLNLRVIPKMLGVGIYRIYLDNGMPIELTFSVIKTLSQDSTSIQLTNFGNESVTQAYYSRSEESEFDNVLNIEILNPSDSEDIQFGNVAQVSITANVGTDGIKLSMPDVNGVVSIAKIENYYRISTLENGDVQIKFELSGLKIDNFETQKNEIDVYVNISSYSLINEFYLKNGENYALNNTVYYSGTENQILQEKDTSVTLTPIVQNTRSKNFFSYYFVDEVLVDAFEGAVENEKGEEKSYSYDINNSHISNELVYEYYNRKFIYFYSAIIYSNGSEMQQTATKVEITKTNNDKEKKSETKIISLNLPNGLMFWSDDDIEYKEKDQNGDIVATYSVKFSNVYSIGSYGSFDMENFTYKNEISQTKYTLSISANLRQRNLTKKYDVKIVSTEYQSVESISLATSLTQLNFTNNDLIYNVGVYTYPTNSTNKNIRVEFVRTNNNPYSDMVTWEIKTVEKDSGVFTVNLSCEKFYKDRGDAIVNEERSLTGKIYIYPSEWGDSYTSINANLTPICIDVHYRNGSKANPYLLETAEDIVGINANKTTLKSHYEISTVIDMSATKDFTPIGILGDVVEGFSGSIIGTNSQSAISNIVVSGTNFVKTVDSQQYAGLFAQINEEAEIENITFSGKFALDLEENAYVGLLSSINKGLLTNVEVKIDKSSLEYSKSGKKLLFGAVAGENYGKIIQDFTKYDGTESNGDRDFSGQTSKKLAYYNEFVEIKVQNTSVCAGGIAGVSYGQIEKISSSTLKLYGYSSYSAYTLLKVVGKSNSSYNLNVGGAVGAVISYDKNADNPNVKGLLVGGEVDTSSVKTQDNVGGIAGYVDTKNNKKIDILANVSRVFLRAYKYVGGIVGYDKYTTSYDADNIVNYLSDGDINKNIIEAVDDGRNNVFSAMIIRYSKLTDSEEKKIETIDASIFYAVGNSLVNSKNYVAFEHNSYLKRNYLDVTKNGAEEFSVSINSASNTDYYGNYLIVTDNENSSYIIHKQYNFISKEVDLNLGESDYMMKEKDEGSDIGVYFMYYFAVQSRLIGGENGFAQDEIEDLNFVTPNSKFYPFSINSQDVSISSSSSNILTVDIDGNLIVKGTGLAVITLTSLLNVVKSRVLYVYIVNYFDKDVSSSIFYTAPNLNGVNIANDSVVNIYGNSSTSIYVVPSYNLEENMTYNKYKFNISSEGVLNYKNVNYLLSKNTQVSVDDVDDSKSGFSAVQINKQTIIFYKNKEIISEDVVDNYKLVPMLQIEIQIGDKKCVYCYELTKTAIDLSISYKETATSIRTNYKYHAMKTNNEFSDVVTIDSTNKNEFLFYQIFKRDGDIETLCQSRLPDYVGEINNNEKWSKYINYDDVYSSEERLFDINFIRREGTTNVFDYTCRINTNSSKFINRFDEDIFGEYIVRLYASELENGISYSFVIILDEAEINYISIENFSNIKDISVADSILVPSQRGVLEVSLDPVEAVFDKFTITNNKCNYQTGATEASLTFVYEKITRSGIEYVQASNFGEYSNGSYSFTYKEMLEYFEQLNDKFEDEEASVNYVGKIYLSYYMPTKNVDDGVTVGFDVNVTYGNTGKDSMSATILLTTKLGSYAKLSFATKSNHGDVYYVARGLSYDMVLDYYGFEENQISISSSNNFIANVVADNGNYKLKITSESINYSEDEGYKVEIKTVASKVVDNVQITTIDTITIYVMEYVMNYVYVEGENEDIVNGMEDGIIYTAIGNPYTLEFSIRKFLEYDKTNLTVNKEVDYFVEEMTKNIKWKVYFDDTETVLEKNKTIKTNYYSIKSYTITPLKIYNAESDIYHFSAGGYYKMEKGIYKHSESASNAEMIYTEFSFEVHQQSTEDSPIPVETYQELIDMKDNEWYILLNDITIPSKDLNMAENDTAFSPITAKIAGLDGNGYKIKFAGTYEFSNISNIGLFEKLTQNAILKNVTLYLTQSVVFKTDASTYNIGVLVCENAGIITNCSIESADGATLSVVCSTTASSSYVAGLVADNSGTITNSRSSVNILSNSNLAGVVGKNSGKIASSYYLGASLKNETNTTSEFTAGFVVENTGSIYTSYVSGKAEIDTMFYNKADNTIQSSNNITGFVYSNSGEVFDCYSNIQLKQSGAFASGFVFENSGEIGRCFSTSVLESNQTSNYGFARINSISGTKGTISNCYYLEDKDAESYLSGSNDKTKGVNISIGKIVVDEQTDIEALTIEEFGKVDKYFSSYVVANGRDINSVWFYNDDK